MATTTEGPAIHSRILKTEPIKMEITSNSFSKKDLKHFSPEDRARLRQSILNNNFIQPFYVWEVAGWYPVLPGWLSPHPGSAFNGG
jgi:hypothetical protein